VPLEPVEALVVATVIPVVAVDVLGFPIVAPPDAIFPAPPAPTGTAYV
jgi:hypothetical protein